MVKMIDKLCVFLIVSQTMLFAHAQESSDINSNSVDFLKGKYKESTAVVLYEEKTIDFELAKEKVNVIETSNNRLMSLRLDNTIKKGIFYDINSKISDDYVKSEKNKNLKVIPTCGNFESDDIFHSDHMICVYPIYFEQLGEIQNFNYKLTNNDIRYFPTVYFQSELPVQSAKIIFKIPAWLDLELIEMNFENYKIEKTIKKDTKKGITIYEYTAKELDEFKNEPNSYGVSHTYPHILIVAKSFKNNDGKSQNIISNVDDLYKWYNHLVLQLKNDNSSFKPTVDKLVAGAKTDLDKIKAIFNWVQDNIRYIAFENGIAGYKPAEASEVFTSKYGDCKGMANLTKWMLKTAGYDATLVWIGTNSIPYNYNTPSLAINNHMICCVNYKKSLYFLDATEKYVGFNDYAERIQGRVVLIEDGENYKIDTIPVFDKSRNLNNIQFDLVMNEDKLTGKCKKEYHGESHQQILYYLNNLKKENIKELQELLITANDKNMIANNISSSDVNDKENAYHIGAEVTINNKISNFDNDFYVDLDFYKDFNNGKIKANRKSDVFFNEKKYQKMTVTLTIPEKFKVKYLPPALELKENSFSFNIKYNVKNNIITYERIISIDNGYFPKSDIEKWNNAIKAVSEKYSDHIILTKK